MKRQCYVTLWLCFHRTELHQRQGSLAKSPLVCSRFSARQLAIDVYVLPATLAIAGPGTNFETFHAVFAAELEAEAEVAPEPELEPHVPHWAPREKLIRRLAAPARTQCRQELLP